MKFSYVLFLLRHTYPTRYVLGNGTYNIKRMKHRNIDFSVVRFHSFTRNRIVLISLPLVFFSFLILSHEKAVADPSNFCLLYCQPATGENIFDKIRSLKQASLTKKKKRCRWVEYCFDDKQKIYCPTQKGTESKEVINLNKSNHSSCRMVIW